MLSRLRWFWQWREYEGELVPRPQTYLLLYSAALGVAAAVVYVLK